MKVPKNWNEITIEKYYNLVSVTKTEYKNDEVKSFAILGALAGVEPEYFENIPITDLKQLLNDSDFISNPITNKPVTPFFKLKGRKFFFDMVLRDSIAGCFIDLSEYAKEPSTNIHNVLSVFCYEVNWLGKRKKKTINMQREYANFFLKNLTMDIAISYSGFFLTSYEKLQEATRIYLDKQIAKSRKMILKAINQSS